MSLFITKALERHKKLGASIVVMKAGKIVEIPPEEIEVPPFPDDSELDESKY